MAEKRAPLGMRIKRHLGLGQHSALPGFDMRAATSKDRERNRQCQALRHERLDSLRRL
jgi:hypothetical protein